MVTHIPQSKHFGKFYKATHSQSFEPLIVLGEAWGRRTKDLIPEGGSVKNEQLIYLFFEFTLKLGKLSGYTLKHSRTYAHTHSCISKSPHRLLHPVSTFLNNIDI